MSESRSSSRLFPSEIWEEIAAFLPLSEQALLSGTSKFIQQAVENKLAQTLSLGPNHIGKPSCDAVLQWVCARFHRLQHWDLSDFPHTSPLMLRPLLSAPMSHSLQTLSVAWCGLNIESEPLLAIARACPNLLELDCTGCELIDIVAARNIMAVSQDKVLRVRRLPAWIVGRWLSSDHPIIPDDEWQEYSVDGTYRASRSFQNVGHLLMIERYNVEALQV